MSLFTDRNTGINTYWAWFLKIHFQLHEEAQLFHKHFPQFVSKNKLYHLVPTSMIRGSISYLNAKPRRQNFKFVRLSLMGILQEIDMKLVVTIWYMTLLVLDAGASSPCWLESDSIDWTLDYEIKGLIWLSHQSWILRKMARCFIKWYQRKRSRDRNFSVWEYDSGASSPC